MQSYLNAFVVSDFKSVSNKDTILQGETLQSVYGVPSVIDAGEANFALEAGVKILKGLEQHLNYPYPLPKLDQVSV
jgi:aminopeptidase N